jgi:hypothetical protein
MAAPFNCRMNSPVRSMKGSTDIASGAGGSGSNQTSRAAGGSPQAIECCWSAPP